MTTLTVDEALDHNSKVMAQLRRQRRILRNLDGRASREALKATLFQFLGWLTPIPPIRRQFRRKARVQAIRAQHILEEACQLAREWLSHSEEMDWDWVWFYVRRHVLEQDFDLDYLWVDGAINARYSPLLPRYPGAARQYRQAQGLMARANSLTRQARFFKSLRLASNRQLGLVVEACQLYRQAYILAAVSPTTEWGQRLAFWAHRHLRETQRYFRLQPLPTDVMPEHERVSWEEFREGLKAAQLCWV